MKAGDLRPGMGVKMDGKLMVVVQYEHRTPGNLRAFTQVKLRDISSGKHFEKRFNPAEELEGITLDRREMEFLFGDGAGGGTFMDTSSYDQVELSAETLGDTLLYLAPNSSCIMLFHDAIPVTIELPSSVDLTIVETPPGIKGATATNQLKEATCDTGLKTRVPPFIEIGEKVRISTADGAYMSRVKAE